MAKKSNIEKYNDSLSSVERIENARKSGIASGKARREGRIMREALLEALDQEGMMEKISKALIEKAVNGDVSAIRLLRDSIGELPSMAINIEKEQRETVAFVMNPDEVRVVNQIAGFLPDIHFHLKYLGTEESFARDKEIIENMNLFDNVD